MGNNAYSYYFRDDIPKKKLYLLVEFVPQLWWKLVWILCPCSAQQFKGFPMSRQVHSRWTVLKSGLLFDFLLLGLVTTGRMTFEMLYLHFSPSRIPINLIPRLTIRLTAYQRP